MMINFEFLATLVEGLKPFLWFLPLLLIVAILKLPGVKGWFGEKWVEKKAVKTLPPGTYRPFHNLTLADASGTTQIDHVYVSPFGIFVVETKNYQGWIFARASDKYWTQTLRGRKSRFQNPLRQNYRHIKALEACLNIAETTFHSVIVFTGSATFKTELPKNVCTLKNFDAYIRSFQERLLSDEQVQQACQILNKERLEVSRETHRKHVSHLRDKHRKHL
ncbi:NERD domain-containing protein [Suttonella sp. R2A3]|uniref:nuclease-related domain-containing protein n=1 Tax=Suttonella sp. R2A3 TaxID=2908648 RepID=UPI001F20695C|nr:nuclease-related domain-containing protein [Suttonella sp. R2A3]UJF24003.1 NERD domain-containing protein [Suttonella sp. R2A3]